MAKARTLTVERLKEVLNYDQTIGIFTWRLAGRGRKKGGIAGSVDKKYRIIRIDLVDYQAARLAWFWVYGEWPSVIRFNSGNSDDCRIENLRNGRYVQEGKYNWRTKEGRAAQQKEYRSTIVDRIRDERLREKFGISLEDYNKKHEAQNGLCAICSKPETRKRNGKVTWLAVDHCHTTGKVRDLLCTNCNPLLGYAKEDAEVLRMAINYLNRHKDSQRREEGL